MLQNGLRFKFRESQELGAVKLLTELLMVVDTLSKISIDYSLVTVSFNIITKSLKTLREGNAKKSLNSIEDGSLSSSAEL